MLDWITTSIFVFTMQEGKIPIMIAAACEQRELVEILLPRTKPIPSLPDWSIDGIIRTIKYLQSKPRVCQNLSRTSRSRDSIVKAAAMAPSPFEVAVEAAVNGNLLRLRGMCAPHLFPNPWRGALFDKFPLFLVEIASTMDLRRARGYKGRNLLHFAVGKGRLDLCRFLVEESGFDANSTSAEGILMYCRSLNLVLWIGW